MSILKNPYTITLLGTDLKDPIIGSSEMATSSDDFSKKQAYAFEPNLSRNVNGVKKLSFKMYSKFFDATTGLLVDNPFAQYLINERQIVLSVTKFKTSTATSEQGEGSNQASENTSEKEEQYLFILKNISENSKTYLNTYSFEDGLVQELAKNGFNVVLDEKLGNNTGNLQTLAEKALEDIDWTVEVQGSVDDWVQDFAVQISGGFAPYSSCVNKPFIFQKGSVGDTPDKEGFYSFTETSATIYDPSKYKDTGNGMFLPGGGSASVFPNKRIKRKNYVHLAKYIPLLDRYVNLYDKGGVSYYGYVESKFKSPIFVQNLVSNYSFEGTSGWTGTTTKEKGEKATIESVYGRFVSNKFVSATEDLMDGTYSEENDYSTYLKIVLPDVNSVAVNSGPRDNREVIENIAPGSEWALRYVVCTENGDIYENSRLSITIGEYSYNSGNDYYKKDGTIDNKAIELQQTRTTNTEESSEECLIYSLSNDSSVKYSDENFKKNSNIRLLISKDSKTSGEEKVFYLKEIELFKVVKNEDGVIILPDKIERKRQTTSATETIEMLDQTVEKTYKYFKADEVNNATSLEQIKPETITSVLTYDTYVPVHNGGEKIRSVNVKESNYFNILQTLAENFGMWLVLEATIEDGKIENKKAIFKEYVGTKKTNAGFEYGVNLQEIQRTQESKNIVSKLIVKQNSNQYGDNGFCTIARAKSNPTGDSCIYDFRYFQDMGLMDVSSFLDEYESSGYFPTIRELNRELRDLNEQYSKSASELVQYQAKYELAKAGFDAAEASIGEIKNSFETAVGFPLDAMPLTIQSVTLDNTKVSGTEGEKEGHLVYEDYDLNPSVAISSSVGDDGKYTVTITVTVTHGGEVGSEYLEHIFYIHAYPKIKTGTADNVKETVKEYVVIVTTPKGTIGEAEDSKKATGSGTFVISSVDISSGDGQKYVKEYSEYIRQKERYYKQLQDLKIESDTPGIYTGKLVDAEKAHNDLKDKIKKKENEKKEKDKDFFSDYSLYIHEGTWINEECVDDEKYYSDALSVMYNSSYPKAAYTINVVDVSVLGRSGDYSGFEKYNFDVGDTTSIIDKEFFGTEDGIPVVVTELIENLDDPSKNVIKVQNFKDQFQDLFQKITATVQEARFSTGSYQKAVALAEANQAKKQAFLSDAMDSATARLTTAGQQSVTWGNDGITVKSVDSPCDAIRMVGGAILLSKQDKNGEQKWVTGVTSDGISANLITTGILNAGEISIMNYDEPLFRWDSFGLSAFDAYWYDSEIGTTISDINTSKFVRFDKHGLYGINDSSIDGLAWHPGTNINMTAQEEIDDKATFSLTWEGFKVTNKNGVTLRIGDSAKIGEGSTDLLSVRNKKDEVILHITETGDLLWSGGGGGGDTPGGDTSFPIKYLWCKSSTKPSAPTDDYDDYSDTSTSGMWHKQLQNDDNYQVISENYGAANSWKGPYQIVGSAGTDAYSLSLSNDSDTVVYTPDGVCISTLPTFTIDKYSGDSETDIGYVSVSIDGASAVNSLNSDYYILAGGNSETKNVTFQIKALPEDFVEGNYTFYWASGLAAGTANYTGTLYGTKTFKLKKITSLVDYDFAIPQTVINPSTNGSFEIFVQKKSSSGVERLDGPGSELALYEKSGNTEILISAESSGNRVGKWPLQSYSSGQTSEMSYVLKSADGAIVWDEETIEFVNNGTSPKLYRFTFSDDFIPVAASPAGTILEQNWSKEITVYPKRNDSTYVFIQQKEKEENEFADSDPIYIRSSLNNLNEDILEISCENISYELITKEVPDTIGNYKLTRQITGFKFKNLNADTAVVTFNWKSSSKVLYASNSISFAKQKQGIQGISGETYRISLDEDFVTIPATNLGDISSGSIEITPTVYFGNSSVDWTDSNNKLSIDVNSSYLSHSDLSGGKYTIGWSSTLTTVDRAVATFILKHDGNEVDRTTFEAVKQKGSMGAIQCYVHSSAGTIFDDAATGNTVLTAKIFEGATEIDKDGKTLDYIWYLDDAETDWAEYNGTTKQAEVQLSTLKEHSVHFTATKKIQS